MTNAPLDAIGTPTTGFAGQGPATCMHCVHRTPHSMNSAGEEVDSCSHPKVMADPALVHLKLPDGAIAVDFDDWCWYFRPPPDNGIDDTKLSDTHKDNACAVSDNPRNIECVSNMKMNLTITGDIDQTQLAPLLASAGVKAMPADVTPVAASTLVPLADDNQDYATVSGTKVKREDFAYAPAGSKPSEWKLPVHDKEHAQNALARFNQTDLPADAKSGVRSKVIAAAHKFGIDTAGFEKEHAEVKAADTVANVIADPALGPTTQPNADQIALADAAVIPTVTEHDGHLFWLLSDLALMNHEGKEVYELPIAMTGTWVKNGRRFSITDQDIDDMIRNFEGRGNGTVVVDYEHASEQPEVAQGGPVPAAGWHYKLSKRQIVNKQGKMLNALTALIGFTPKAKDMLANGEYKFFSPAIHFDKKDKETGESIGAYLNSGALTNHPFLEGLPPIVLSDLLLSTLQSVHVGSTIPVSVDFDNGGLAVPAAGKVIATESNNDKEKKAKKETKRMKKTIKKIADGPDKGKFGMYAEDGKIVKTLSQKLSDKLEAMADKDRDEMCTELCDMADMGPSNLADAPPKEPDADDKKGGAGKKDGDADDEKSKGAGGNIVGSDVAPKIVPAPVVVAPAATPAPEGKITMNEPVKTTAVLLSECITAEGRLDAEKVVNLAAELKIKPEEAAKAVKLNDTVQGLVNTGIFKPNQFGTAIGWALRDETGFNTFIATAAPQIDLSTRGLTLTDSKGNVAVNPAIGDPNDKEKAFMTLCDEVYTKNRALNPTYSHEEALKEASRQKPELFNEYRNATVNLSDRPTVASMSLGDRPVLRNTFSPDVTSRVSF